MLKTNIIYLDDVMVAKRNLQERLRNLSEVFNRFAAANQKLNSKKWALLQ